MNSLSPRPSGQSCRGGTSLPRRVGQQYDGDSNKCPRTGERWARTSNEQPAARDRRCDTGVALPPTARFSGSKTRIQPALAMRQPEGCCTIFARAQIRKRRRLRDLRPNCMSYHAANAARFRVGQAGGARLTKGRGRDKADQGGKEKRDLGKRRASIENVWECWKSGG